ncbi:MAG: hypothetical protein AB8B54_06080 [Sphingorhabdus sp.]
MVTKRNKKSPGLAQGFAVGLRNETWGLGVAFVSEAIKTTDFMSGKKACDCRKRR